MNYAILFQLWKGAGHTRTSTTFRYVNINANTARGAADLSNQFNNAAAKEEHAILN